MLQRREILPLLYSKPAVLRHVIGTADHMAAFHGDKEAATFARRLNERDKLCDAFMLRGLHACLDHLDGSGQCFHKSNAAAFVDLHAAARLYADSSPWPLIERIRAICDSYGEGVRWLEGTRTTLVYDMGEEHYVDVAMECATELGLDHVDSGENDDLPFRLAYRDGNATAIFEADDHAAEKHGTAAFRVTVHRNRDLG